MGGRDVGGEVCFYFPQHQGMYFYTVISGECWVATEGHEPLLLTAGDCVLLTSGRPFRLANDFSLEDMPSSLLWSSPTAKRVDSFQGGGRCLMYCGYFGFEKTRADFLKSILPSVLMVPAEHSTEPLTLTIKQMIQECDSELAGSGLVLDYLSHLIFIYTLRAYQFSHLDDVGWLSAMADSKISKALQAMHAHFDQKWTLHSLSEAAGMSRTAFVNRFRTLVHSTPMDYLLQWRMVNAAQLLEDTELSVSAISQAVGYESESAFGVAFKRCMGCSPRQYIALQTT